jgi:imidazoleglycerol phosphate synthase cyclase subunit
VKGIKFQNLQEAGSPADRSFEYQQQGADELVMLDVSATIEERKTAHETIREIRKGLCIPLTVGGGVKHVDDAQVILEAGADKVSVNTAAVRDPSILTAMATKFGRQCTVLAIDAIQSGPDTWEVVVSSGKEKTGKSVVEWAIEGVEKGAGEILLTSWDRDGTKSGYDLDLLRRVSAAVQVPVIASGGAANAGHLSDAMGAGADAVLAASIFHYGEYTVGTLKVRFAYAFIALIWPLSISNVRPNRTNSRTSTKCVLLSQSRPRLLSRSLPTLLFLASIL